MSAPGQKKPPLDDEVISIWELLAAPPVLDLLTAAKALGVGRTTAYALARSGRFPCRIITLGSARRPSYRVPTADLHRLLGLTGLASERSSSENTMDVTAVIRTGLTGE